MINGIEVEFELVKNHCFISFFKFNFEIYVAVHFGVLDHVQDVMYKVTNHVQVYI